MPIQARIPRTLLLADAAWRLGPRALVHYGRHRLALASGQAARRLTGAAAPEGRFLAELPSPPPPPLPGAWQARLRAALAVLPPARHHGPFDPAGPALGMDLFHPGDVRPVWEAGRLACLPKLAQAACLWPEEGHHAALEARLTAWCAANPPFRGPHWACGQEAALRALHLALALALLGQDGAPAPGARCFLALHARRIGATSHYAQAQDNNHSISEPAGLCLRPAARRCRAARARRRRPCRRGAAGGAGWRLRPGFHRLPPAAAGCAVHRGMAAAPAWRPGLPRPFAERAAVAARWLAGLVAPDGALPRLGHQDGSAFADLALAGPTDARGSVERAMRLFAGASAGFAEEPGCDWLALPAAPAFTPPASWRAAGSMGWRQDGARALLRTGPLRFRPGQVDLLHFELWDGATPLLTDAGTGAYNPAPADRWWLEYFSGAAAHNTITFDEREPMPRAGRFLHARWPRLSALPDGAALRDANGHHHARRVSAEGRLWRVRDEVGGGFSTLALRWRLGPGAWRATPEGATGPARIRIEAEAPLALRLEEGWESPAYGQVRRCTLLVARAAAPLRWIETEIGLG
ncbi:heparinase II/III-family protein [Pseudoroseomonas wenyumeiae]